MTKKSTISPVNFSVRRFNKHVLNPLMLRLAGRKHWYTSAIEHTGRRSGTTYRTPIVAHPVSGGYLTPLPYGVDTDWLRNTLAAGEAVITNGGKRSTVINPRLIDAAEAATVLPARRLRAFRRLGIGRFVRFDLGPAAGKAAGNAH